MTVRVMPSKIGCTSPIFGIVIVPICTSFTGAYGSDGGASGTGNGSVVVVTGARRVTCGTVVTVVGGNVTSGARRGSSPPFDAAALFMTNAVDAHAAATI